MEIKIAWRLIHGAGGLRIGKIRLCDTSESGVIKITSQHHNYINPIIGCSTFLLRYLFLRSFLFALYTKKKTKAMADMQQGH